MENTNVFKKPRKISAVIISVLLVILLGANVACGMYSNIITQFFSRVNVDESLTAKAGESGKAITEEVEEEGIVLLKNSDNKFPLDLTKNKEKNINVFGWSAISPIYGGNGSGAADESSNVTLIHGLENAGFSVNQDIIDFYEELKYSRLVKNAFGEFATGFEKVEAPVEEYSQELLDSAKEYSDAALIVISRIGSEGSDLPTDMSENGGNSDEHYLELSEKEQAMVDMVCNMGFKKVGVLINSSHVMELGFLDNDVIDAAFWIGGPGSTGMNAVGNVLAGNINPSGRLTDTYAYDATSAPSYYNFGEFAYTNSAHEVFSPFSGGMVPAMEHYVDYQEGIYVGYRYYETRWIDNKTGSCDETAYQEAVQYPFGYGLSYSSFSQEMGQLKTENGQISVDVTVTNTGDMPGKEVVQIYYTAPYTVGGIEKSHVVLSAFDKTTLLSPGESETLTLSFNVEDMASYDYINEKSYVLDEGTYEIKLMSNAHNVIASKDYQVTERVVYTGDNKRKSDQIAATNQFDYMLEEGTSFVSRADWEGTLPTVRTEPREARQKVLDACVNYEVESDDTAEEIVFADNGLKLSDMAGLEYDDPQWEKLLEQLSVEDMKNLIGFGGWQTQVVDSVDKPLAVDIDGPAGLNALINETAYEGIQYASGVVLASTWNLELIYKMGETYGEEANSWEVSGLYAPGINIHRSPFGGRNFEYYSEDAFLSGKVAASEIAGIQSKGVYCYMKHLALNDQETQRYGLCIWANEQSMREIYFKPFETAVKEANAMGAMSAFSRLGSTWCGASYELCTTVLRDEWGFYGTVVTDYCGNSFMDADQAIRAGNDLMLSSTGVVPSDTSSAGLQAMRNASHNILYTTLNSNAMEFNNQGPKPYWAYALAIVDIIALLLSIWYFVTFAKRYKAYKQEDR